MTQPAANNAQTVRGFPWSRIALGLLLTLGLFVPLFRTSGVEWQLAQAERYRSDPAKSLTYVDAAVAKDPENISARQMRIVLLNRLGKIDDAIVATSEALAISATSPDARIGLLLQRARLRQQLGQHVAAIRDANEALSIGERLVLPDDGSKQETLAQLRNERAYLIARAAIAGKMNRQLVANAQRDMQQVFVALQQNRKRATERDELQTLHTWLDEAQYLDTSAYLSLAAGDSRAALRDFNRALQLLDAIELMIEREATQLPRDEFDKLRAALPSTRAVVLHHRGETLLAMGDEQQAAISIAVAKRLGYNRATGNW